MIDQLTAVVVVVAVLGAGWLVGEIRIRIHQRQR